MESVKRVKNSEQIPSIYLVSILAAEKILKKMQSFLKKYTVLSKEELREHRYQRFRGM